MAYDSGQSCVAVCKRYSMTAKLHTVYELCPLVVTG